MSHPREAWSRIHDLALVYVALAYGTDSQLSDSEIDTVVTALHRWRPDISINDVREIVLEALAILLDEDASDEVVAAIDRLQSSLSAEERRTALEDVVQIAQADGVILGRERTFISHLARAWSVKSEAADLLQQTSAAADEDAEWSLLHDLGLIYIVMAHSTDNKLSDPEIAAMVERLNQWQPELSEPEVRVVLRESLQVYSKEPDRDELMRSVLALRDSLPFLQRVAVLDDLSYIAASDGAMNEHEQQMISTLSKAFKVDVRFNGAEEV